MVTVELRPLAWSPAWAVKAQNESAKARTISFLMKIGRAHVELQSPMYLVCRLLLEKKKTRRQPRHANTYYCLHRNEGGADCFLPVYRRPSPPHRSRARRHLTRLRRDHFPAR